jgi:hypothetical protein
MRTELIPGILIEHVAEFFVHGEPSAQPRQRHRIAGNAPAPNPSQAKVSEDREAQPMDV